MDYPGYLISSDGRILSYWRRGKSYLFETANELKQTRGRPSLNKYLKVTLRRFDGKLITCPVHRLVLEAFVGPCPEGQVGTHVDGDMLNNRLSNLRWNTQLRNIRDKYRHGTVLYNEKHQNCVLSRQDVQDIKERRQKGASLVALAAKYKVAKTTISKIVSGRARLHA